MSQLRTYCFLLAALLLSGCAAAGAAGYTAADAAGYTAAGAAGPSAGHTLAGTARATGHVTGKLLIEGGAIGPGGQQPGERPIPGTVTFTAAGHRPVSVMAGTPGTFSAWLPPGRYQVAGRSPDIETVTSSGKTLEQACSQPVSVTIRAGHATTIAVVCIVP
jgi:hypothetical protein